MPYLLVLRSAAIRQEELLRRPPISCPPKELGRKFLFLGRPKSTFLFVFLINIRGYLEGKDNIYSVPFLHTMFMGRESNYQRSPNFKTAFYCLVTTFFLVSHNFFPITLPTPTYPPKRTNHLRPDITLVACYYGIFRRIISKNSGTELKLRYRTLFMLCSTSEFMGLIFGLSCFFYTFKLIAD